MTSNATTKVGNFNEDLCNELQSSVEASTQLLIEVLQLQMQRPYPLQCL